MSKGNGGCTNVQYAKEKLMKISEHHLIPKSKGGKETITICLDCHNSIHSFFTNKELEDKYNTIKKLLSYERFSKHIRWLSKQNPNKRYKSKIVNDKKKRGRSN